ncbi:MAG TPA: putative glycoside hydrolase [Solirubrobacteraceae bacterium]|nr:putative glycoside hydrolase [Solirubrobacteraceae bacterium]
MRSSTRAVTVLLACAGALLWPCLGSAETVGHYDSATTTPAAFANPALSAQRNTYIDLQAWEGAKAAELKAANPHLKVLVYQNLGAMSQGIGPNGLSSSGVNYAEANSAHPGWFLTGAGGERLAFEDFKWLWAADVANPEYQHLWAANVIRLLTSGPWDGVMMDDTNTTNRYHFNPSSKVTKYPTDAAYQGAVRSMLEYVGPAIQAAGKLAVPNMGSWSEYPAAVKEWLPFVSGGMDEMFVKWSKSAGQGYRGSHEWESEVGEIATTESMGKQFIAITQAEPGDAQGARYGWASTLLAGNGHTIFMASNGHPGEETWLGDYETAIGTPTSAAAALGNGAWQRQFTNGLVLVNPTTSSVQASFGAAYSGDGLTNATGATLAPHSALVLTRAGGPASSGAIARVASLGPGLLLTGMRFQRVSGSGGTRYRHRHHANSTLRCRHVKASGQRRHVRGTRVVCRGHRRGQSHAVRGPAAASRRA